VTCTTLAGESRVYYVATDINDDNHVRELAWWGNKWHAGKIADRTGGTNTVNLTSTTVAGNPRVYYWEARPEFKMEIKIVEQAWWGNDWHELVLGGGPEFLDCETAVACTTLAGNPRVYYAHHFVCELAYWGGTEWVRREVGTEAGTFPRESQSSLTSVTLVDSPRVYWVAYEEGRTRVHDLAYRSDTNTWVDTPISS